MTNFPECTSYLNFHDFDTLKKSWIESTPFNHLIIDNFLLPDVIDIISKEFPEFNSNSWKIYNNPIEIKKVINHWDKFGPETYKLFSYLMSRDFVSRLEVLTACDLFPDFGLNGGGLHIHKRGGKLNPHLDYSIHPKLKLERRLNIIIYVTPNWNAEWGGALGLWDQGLIMNRPGRLIKSITPIFNRAVIFDTTQNSWHGLPDPIDCPKNITRNSLALYYLCKPRTEASDRGKALFSPYKDQENDPKILELIEKRSKIESAPDSYGD